MINENNDKSEMLKIGKDEQNEKQQLDEMKTNYEL